MKKFLTMAAAVLALMSCNKEPVQSSADEAGQTFYEGQEITITCGTGLTKVTGMENDSKGIDFEWETGDVIKVTESISGKYSFFTLKGTAGGATAKFSGVVPATGTTYNIQYPVSDPDLTSQTYIAGALPHNKMKFAATGCTLESAIELDAQYSALRLNLYGWDRQVNSITVTNLSDSKTYTLSCDSAVTVGSSSEEATPFLLVMPTGTYNFKVEVTSEDNGAGTELPDYIDENGVNQDKGILIITGTMETTSEKKFTENHVLNLSARAITQIWAPVNCGYDADNTFGLLYQWGRKYGQVYGYIAPETMTKEQGEDYNYSSKFGSQNSTDSNWFSGGVDNTLWNGSPKGSYDPCPTGWRVPTESELTALIANKSSWTTNAGQNGYRFSGSTVYSDIVPSVFLPATGFRGGDTGTVGYYNSAALYWSSSVNVNSARAMNFYNGSVSLLDNPRANGDAVRCIKSEESTATAGGFSEVTTW